MPGKIPLDDPNRDPLFDAILDALIKKGFFATTDDGTDQKRDHGYWRPSEDGSGDFVCSECGFKLPDEIDYCSKYCYNCGAKMGD